MRTGTQFVRPSTKASRPEWENMYYKYVELHEAVNLRKAKSQ